MASSIKRILSKTNWTGEEVGKVLIAAFVQEITSKGKSYLLTPDELRAMVATLKTEPQLKVYYTYNAIYNLGIDCHNAGESMIQQFYHGYYKLFMALSQTTKAEIALKNINRTPLILTKSQYNDIKAAVLKENNSTMWTYSNLLLFYLDYCIDHEDSIPEDIKKALDDCKNELADNEKLLAQYAEELDLHYYVLNDGTDSRNCTPEEFTEALKRAYIDYYHLPENATDEDIREHENTTRQNILVTLYKYSYKGIDYLAEQLKKQGLSSQEISKYNNIDELIEFVENTTCSFWGMNVDNPKICNLVEITEAPKNTTKYDILVSGIYEYWTDEIRDDFIGDYPALYEALASSLNKMLEVKKQPALDDEYQEGELVKKNIPFIDNTVTDAQIFSYYIENNKLASYIGYTGIAVLSEESSDFLTGENIVIHTSDIDLGLESLDADIVTQIEGSISVLIAPAIKKIYAYNVLFDVLAEYYDIPELKKAKIDLSYLEEKIEAYNTALYALHGFFRDSPEKEKKRELLRDYFQPIDYKDYEPEQEAIDLLRAYINELGYGQNAIYKLSNFEGIINVFFIEGVDNGE